MSVVRADGTKTLLPRSGPDAFWSAIREGYAGRDPRAWRRLAMFALREDVGWPIDLIAATFGRDEGHVARCLDEVRRDLKTLFRPEGRDVGRAP